MSFRTNKKPKLFLQPFQYRLGCKFNIRGSKPPKMKLLIQILALPF